MQGYYILCWGGGEYHHMGGFSDIGSDIIGSKRVNFLLGNPGGGVIMNIIITVLGGLCGGLSFYVSIIGEQKSPLL